MLGFKTVSQLISGTPDPKVEFFQKKFRCILFNCEEMVFGNEKHCMVCAGRDSKWD